MEAPFYSIPVGLHRLCPARYSRYSEWDGAIKGQQDRHEDVRRISVQKICESRLLGSVSNLNGLVDYVNDLKQVRRGKCQVSMRQTNAMEAMCHLQGCSVP